MKPLAILAAAGFTLASCNSTSATDIATTIASVQKTAMQICGFLPYATTIAAIFNKQSEGLKTAADIAKALCDAVKPPSGTPSASASVGTPKIGDVQIEGEFVRSVPAP